jgi:acyl-CoA hydrolase
MPASRNLWVLADGADRRRTWIYVAHRMILDVNAWQPNAFEGKRETDYGDGLSGYGQPIRLLRGFDRMGISRLQWKIVAVVEPNSPECNATNSDDELINYLAPVLDRAESSS